jgi:hypothetical protein
MRSAKESDFFIELTGVGSFRFGRRTYGDRLKIRSEYLKLVREFGDDDPDLSMYAAMIASHTVLCSEAPEGWENLADIDLVADEKSEDRIYELYQLLKDQEEFFRKGHTQAGQAKG